MKTKFCVTNFWLLSRAFRRNQERTGRGMDESRMRIRALFMKSGQTQSAAGYDSPPDSRGSSTTPATSVRTGAGGSAKVQGVFARLEPQADCAAAPAPASGPPEGAAFKGAVSRSVPADASGESAPRLGQADSCLRSSQSLVDRLVAFRQGGP